MATTCYGCKKGMGERSASVRGIRRPGCFTLSRKHSDVHRDKRSPYRLAGIPDRYARRGLANSGITKTLVFQSGARKADTARDAFSPGLFKQMSMSRIDRFRSRFLCANNGPKRCRITCADCLEVYRRREQEREREHKKRQGRPEGAR